MPSIRTDSALWYNVGLFGEAGYAVPNWSDDIASQNDTILDLTSTMGRNLFAVMHHDDADLRVPPSINTLRRIHKLILRARQILAGRAVPANVANMETAHARPEPEVFRVFPVPYFKVRNCWMRSYCGLVLTALTEAMQHTENRKPFEISTDFAGLIGQYLTRIYTRMAVELFGVPKEQAELPGYIMSEEVLAAYNPSQFFTSTELIDTVAPFNNVFTEDMLLPLSDGIKVTDLPELRPYPTVLDAWSTTSVDAADATETPSSTKGHVPPFPAAPTP